MNTNILLKKTAAIMLIAALLTGCSDAKDLQEPLQEDAFTSEQEESLFIWVQNDTNLDEKDVVKRVKEEAKHLPMWCQEKIEKEQWTLVYTEKEIEEMYDAPGQVEGMTDTQKRVIFIEEGNDNLILHELIHASIYNPSTGSSMYIKYEGIEEEIENSSLDEYFKSELDEYVVESISMYLKGEEEFKELPLTLLTIEEMIESSAWMKK